MKENTVVITIFSALLIIMGLTACEQEKKMNPYINLAKKWFDSAKYGDKVYEVALTIAEGKAPSAESLKSLGAGINKRYGNEITLLFFAVRSYNIKAIDALLGQGADPYMHMIINGRNRGDFAYYVAGIVPNSPAHKEFGDELLHLYIKHGGDPNHKISGTTPMVYGTVFSSNFNNFKYLAEQGANVWAVNEKGNPPHFNVLDVAASSHDYEYIYYALDNNLFSKATKKDIARLIYRLSWYTQREDEISKKKQKITRLILEETGYEGDGNSAMILAGETLYGAERIAKYGKGFEDEGFLDDK